MIRTHLIVGAVLAALLAPQGLGAQSGEVQPSQDPVLGTPAALESSTPEFLWLERGAEIRESPEWQSPVIAIVDIRLQVPVAQERDGWLLVRYAGWKGWVHATGERQPEEIVPFSTAPHQGMLDRALELLGAEIETRRTLGAFSLHTDVPEKKLLEFLNKVATSLPRAYFERFGLDPGRETLETVVIFDREEDYRSYAQTTTDAPGIVSGHATQGIAVAFVGDQSRDEVAAVLIHELTHLLNRRVFRELELPWLDEGMSNDLAYCQVRRRSGELQLATLGGRSVVIERPVYLAGGESRVDRELRLAGPVASLSLLRESQTLLPLEALLTLEAPEFMDQLDLRTRYDQSTFFVRYLLDSGDPELETGLREYLQLLAEHSSADQATDLPSHLGIDPEELSRGFEEWLVSRRFR